MDEPHPSLPHTPDERAITPDPLQEMFGEHYRDLRSIANRFVASEPRRPVASTATSLLHETFLRLARGEQALAGWNSREHFLASAARTMRRVLVDQARGRLALKRGGHRQAISLDGAEPLSRPEHFSQTQGDRRLLEIDRLLEELNASQPRAAEVAAFRLFGRLSVEQTAAALGISEPSVKRDWRFVRAWLRARMEAPEHDT